MNARPPAQPAQPQRKQSPRDPEKKEPWVRFEEWLARAETQAKLTEIAKGFKDLDELADLLLFQFDKNRTLLKCEPASIWRALREAKYLDIPPVGVERGWLVPRREQGVWLCKFDPGWRGLLEVAHRSPKVLAIDAKPVFERDDFDVIEGSHPRIDHRPHVSRKGGGDDSKGAVVAAYCVVHFVGGVALHRVLDREELEKIRAKSTNTSESNPWDVWPSEMALKSACKRGCKLVPGLPQLDRALALAREVDVIDVDGEVADDQAPAQAPAPPPPRHKALAEGIRSNLRAQFGGAEREPQRAAAPPPQWEGRAPAHEAAFADDDDDDHVPFE